MFLRGGDAALHRLLQLFVRRGDVLSGGRFLGVEFAAKLFIASLRRLGRRLGRLLRLLDGGGEFLFATSRRGEFLLRARLERAERLRARRRLRLELRVRGVALGRLRVRALSRAFPFGVQSLPRLRLRRGYRGVAFLLGGGERLARLLLGGEEFLLRLLLHGDDFRLRDAFRLERRVARLRELLRGCFFRRVQLRGGGFVRPGDFLGRVELRLLRRGFAFRISPLELLQFGGGVPSDRLRVRLGVSLSRDEFLNRSLEARHLALELRRDARRVVLLRRRRRVTIRLLRGASLRARKFLAKLLDGRARRLELRGGVVSTPRLLEKFGLRLFRPRLGIRELAHVRVQLRVLLGDFRVDVRARLGDGGVRRREIRLVLCARRVAFGVERVDSLVKRRRRRVLLGERGEVRGGGVLLIRLRRGERSLERRRIRRRAGFETVRLGGESSNFVLGGRQHLFEIRACRLRRFARFRCLGESLAKLGALRRCLLRLGGGSGGALLRHRLERGEIALRRLRPRVRARNRLLTRALRLRDGALEGLLLPLESGGEIRRGCDGVVETRDFHFERRASRLGALRAFRRLRRRVLGVSRRRRFRRLERRDALLRARHLFPRVGGGTLERLCILPRLRRLALRLVGVLFRLVGFLLRLVGVLLRFLGFLLRLVGVLLRLISLLLRLVSFLLRLISLLLRLVGFPLRLVSYPLRRISVLLRRISLLLRLISLRGGARRFPRR